jgi:glycosyltransferase involved in cell wall biosynthesis
MEGFLEKKRLADFYEGARIVVSGSQCFETFGLSVAEAMLYEKPVVATRIGVFPEFVQEGITGLLTKPGDADDLAAKIRILWEQPELCKAMGKAGRAHALSEYSPSVYYTRSMNVFNRAKEHLCAA